MNKKIVLALALPLVLTSCFGNKTDKKEEAVQKAYNQIAVGETVEQAGKKAGSEPEKMSESTYQMTVEDEVISLTVDPETKQIKTKSRNTDNLQNPGVISKVTVSTDHESQITKGMTLEQVEKIVGEPGIEIRDGELMAQTNLFVKMYKWINEDGSYLVVTLNKETGQVLVANFVPAR